MRCLSIDTSFRWFNSSSGQIGIALQEEVLAIAATETRGRVRTQLPVTGLLFEIYNIEIDANSE